MAVAQRLIALDVLRGLTIALMIMVNTPGSWGYVYPPLLHAKWHGCTPTDLVFPFFLLIVLNFLLERKDLLGFQNIKLPNSLIKLKQKYTSMF